MRGVALHRGGGGGPSEALRSAAGGLCQRRARRRQNIGHVGVKIYSKKMSVLPALLPPRSHKCVDQHHNSRACCSCNCSNISIIMKKV